VLELIKIMASVTDLLCKNWQEERKSPEFLNFLQLVAPQQEIFFYNLINVTCASSRVTVCLEEQGV
jgi:hypothetical protein